MANKLVDDLRPQWSRDIRRVETRESAMGADSVEGAARIRQEIKSKDDFFAGVGGILYAKGTAVISMFEQWIGEEAFRVALRGYIRQHSWKTAVADDFFAALAGASDPKLPAAFATFVDQTGVPLVEAELECPGKGKAPSLSLRQSRYVPTGSEAAPAGQLWHIPVCVDHAVGKKVATSCTLMTERETTLALEASRCPDWVQGNADAKGYYRVLYRGKMLEKLLAATARLTPAERLGLIGDVSALTGADKIEVGTALALIPRLERDKSPYVIARAAAIAGGIKELVPPSLQANYRRFLTRTFGARARRLGWVAAKGEDNAVSELRSGLVPLLATDGGDRTLIAGAARLAKKWTTDPSAIETEMLAETLGDAALYEKIRAAALEAKPGARRAALMGALGQFPDPKLTERTLSLMASDEAPFQDLFQIFGGIASDPARRQRLYDFVKANYDPIAAKMPEMARGFLVFAAVPFCDKAHQDDARAFFGPRNEKIQNGERALTQAMNAIDVCIARREREGPGVAKFLRRY
jgi:alanyl aminopeptidase